MGANWGGGGEGRSVFAISTFVLSHFLQLSVEKVTIKISVLAQILRLGVYRIMMYY